MRTLFNKDEPQKFSNKNAVNVEKDKNTMKLIIMLLIKCLNLI